MGRFGSRRQFLFESCGGISGLGLAWLLNQDGLLAADCQAGAGTAAPRRSHFEPRARSVISLFMLGGVSHVDTFDPKPALNKYAGKNISETPFKETLNPAYVKGVRELVKGGHGIKLTLYPMQVGFRQYGQSGAGVSDWFPNVGSMVD